MRHCSNPLSRITETLRTAFNTARPEEVERMAKLTAPVEDLLKRLSGVKDASITFSPFKKNKRLHYPSWGGHFAVGDMLEYSVSVEVGPRTNPEGTPVYGMGQTAKDKSSGWGGLIGTLEELAHEILAHVVKDITACGFDKEEEEKKIELVTRVVEEFLAEQNLQPLEAAPADTPDVMP